MSPLNITQPLDSIRYMVYNGYYKVMSNIPKMGHLTTPVLWARWYQFFERYQFDLFSKSWTSDKCSLFLGVASYLQMSKTWHVLLTMWGPVRSSLSTFIYHNSWSLVDLEGRTHGHLSPLDTTGHLEHSLPCRTCRLLGMENRNVSPPKN